MGSYKVVLDRFIYRNYPSINLKRTVYKNSENDITGSQMQGLCIYSPLKYLFVWFVNPNNDTDFPMSVALFE